MTYNFLPSLTNLPGAINNVWKSTISNIYTTKSYSVKVTQQKASSFYIVKPLCIPSFWLCIGELTGLWSSVHALWPNSVLTCCSGHSRVRSFIKMWSTKRDCVVLRSQGYAFSYTLEFVCWMPLVLCLRLVASSVLTQEHFPPSFSEFDFPLHLFASINAKYWKVQIDFLSKTWKVYFSNFSIS